jgi:hydroxymethylbilane synthase
VKSIRIICRKSRLSLLQAELVKQRILLVAPDAEVIIIGRSSKGDRELSVPLSVLDGSDFFTEEIFAALQNGEADIAVHSLKDMSARHFFSHTAFATPDREDLRDVAIFNPDIVSKIESGATLIIGTSSPRREEMAVRFLKKALPQLGREIQIETRPIRGNVERRLQLLESGAYDATILATAGLNRLLGSSEDAPGVRALLKDKKYMLLPLVECVPAPCQGIIVAEADPANQEAVALLSKINDERVWKEAISEKQKGSEFGAGCLQKFGVATLKTRHTAHLYAAGVDSNGREFSAWSGLPEFSYEGKNFFSSTDYMRNFFQYRWEQALPALNAPVVFVANYKALQQQGLKELLQSKVIWASGTKTWYELAKMGLWVQGSADAMGFEQLLPSLQMPLLNLSKDDLMILTHKKAAERWSLKGYNAQSNYELVPVSDAVVQSKMAQAEFVFWSSFSQYELYKSVIRSNVRHLCAGGETAELLRQQGIEPILFPTIKAFEQWRSTNISSISAV